uniref:Uncharacterized protein n=1 Tax=Salix viminalis TaxID=40686 RepID=A0A6N2NGK5_SALVM
MKRKGGGANLSLGSLNFDYFHAFFSLMETMLLPPLDEYRLHTRKEEEEKNLVPLSKVVKGVLLQQLVQAVVAHALFLQYEKSSVFYVSRTLLFYLSWPWFRAKIKSLGLATTRLQDQFLRVASSLPSTEW